MEMSYAQINVLGLLDRPVKPGDDSTDGSTGWERVYRHAI
jgi:hypothetical protein